MKNKTTLLNLAEKDFNHHVLASMQPVLVLFGTPWSGSCHIMTPIIEELSREFSGKIRFYKLAVDQFPTAAGKFDIRMNPTLVIFKNGKILDHETGVVSKTRLADKLKAALAS